MTDTRKIVESRHRDFLAAQNLLQFYADCAEGGPTWPAKRNPLAIAAVKRNTAGAYNYVSQFSLESADDYIRRLNRAAYVDVCGPALSLYASTVGRPDSVVTDVPEQYGYVL